jgi:hypothetical protein
MVSSPMAKAVEAPVPEVTITSFSASETWSVQASRSGAEA